MNMVIQLIMKLRTRPRPLALPYIVLISAVHRYTPRGLYENETGSEIGKDKRCCLGMQAIDCVYFFTAPLAI